MNTIIVGTKELSDWGDDSKNSTENSWSTASDILVNMNEWTRIA